MDAASEQLADEAQPRNAGFLGSRLDADLDIVALLSASGGIAPRP